MTTTIRVFCVDDNPLVTEALRRRLDREPGLTWAGASTDEAAVVERIVAADPAILLLDIDMPRADAFDILTQLGEKLPTAKVLMFSGHVRRDLIDRALECGAWGYVSKNDSADDLLTAVRLVAAGDVALSPEAQAEQRRS